MPTKQNEMTVPARYTWEQVRGYVTAEHARNRSMRQIADDINQRAGPGVVNITHRTVQLILAGQEPQSAKIRRTLGLPVLKPAPVCACGDLHLRTKCPKSKLPPEYERVVKWLRARERR